MTALARPATLPFAPPVKERAGQSKIPDLQVAGTALAHGAAVATRNVADFEGCGVVVVNPWEYRA